MLLLPRHTIRIRLGSQFPAIVCSNIRCSSGMCHKLKKPSYWWGTATPAEFARLSAKVCITIGLSLVTGDLACQLLEVKPPLTCQTNVGSTSLNEHNGNVQENVWEGLVYRFNQWNLDRSFKMWTIGTFISGPISHCWQVLIDINPLSR